MVNYKSKYLKYKLKYKNFKQKAGSSIYVSKDVFDLIKHEIELIETNLKIYEKSLKQQKQFKSNLIDNIEKLRNEDHTEKQIQIAENTYSDAHASVNRIRSKLNINTNKHNYLKELLVFSDQLLNNLNNQPFEQLQQKIDFCFNLSSIKNDVKKIINYLDKTIIKHLEANYFRNMSDDEIQQDINKKMKKYIN